MMRSVVWPVLLWTLALEVACSWVKRDSNRSASSLSFVSSTGSAAAAAASTTIPAIFHCQFANPTNATTCQNTTILWTYSGDTAATMTLTVTNERVKLPTTPDVAGVPLVTRTVSSNVSCTSQMDIWAADVTEGWYAAIAYQPDDIGVFAQSAPFFVRNGSDISCLAAIPALGPNTPSKSHSLGTGQLIGTVAGVVVGVAIIVAAFSFPRLWRRALPSAKRHGGAYMLH